MSKLRKTKLIAESEIKVSNLDEYEKPYGYEIPLEQFLYLCDFDEDIEFTSILVSRMDKGVKIVCRTEVRYGNVLVESTKLSRDSKYDIELFN